MPEVVLNIREFGAIGDGRIHRVSEWISQGVFFELRTLQMKYPFVDSLNWTIDEVAFARAKLALPPRGGTIHFPSGHYITGQHPWRILRDHVRLTGDGAERTLLSTAPGIADGLVISPYRHAGWLEGAEREYAYTAESGGRGQSQVQLKAPALAGAFNAGDLVFIRCGGNRFDQDYGEFNEVAGTDDRGGLRFVHPLSRDYTLEQVNWAAEVAEDFVMPRRGSAVRVTVHSGEGAFVPPVKATVSIGENVFCVDRATAKSFSLANCGPANAPRGTRIPAGAKIAKARTVLKVTKTSRHFRCEGLQIVGRRKCLNLSNSYDVAFTDCIFVRDLRDGSFQGGVTIDGDGGRFARFERCRIEALPAAGMQFARSFGGVRFHDCSFVNTHIAFTEFNFDCEVSHSRFDLTGNAGLGSVIVAGKSCGDLRFVNNRIHAPGMTSVFDTVSDLHSPKHPGDGEILIRENTIEAPATLESQVALSPSERLAIKDTGGLKN